jgi:hypothetical protein
MSNDQMKAVHYEGAFKVSVKNVPLPKLEHPDDAIIKVTTAGKIFFTFTNEWIRRIVCPLACMNSSYNTPRAIIQHTLFIIY